MNKIILIITVSILSILIWNCDTNEPKETTDEFSDEAVKSAVYHGPKYLSDFFNEDLSNVVLNYMRESDVITFTEPATDDYNTALDFVKIHLSELGLDTTKLVDGQGNDKYFEYRLYPDSSVNHPPYYFRVHKNSYFEGAKFGSQDEDFYQIIELGTINFRPFTLQLVKEFFDQIWFYKHYNMGGAAVLERTISEIAVSINTRSTLLILFLAIMECEIRSHYSKVSLN